MANTVRASAAALAFGLLMPAPASACFGGGGPLPRPHPILVALSGIVLGYVAADAPVEGAKAASGLRVLVDTGVAVTPEVMRWYPLHTRADCSNEGASADEVARAYPSGSRVVTVAQIATPPAGGLRIVAKNYREFGYIARTPEPLLPDAGEFDFAGPGPRAALGYEDFEFYRLLTVVEQRKKDARPALFRRLASYRGFERFGAGPRGRRFTYDALLDWGNVPKDARRALLWYFDGVWGER